MPARVEASGARVAATITMSVAVLSRKAVPGISCPPRRPRDAGPSGPTDVVGPSGARPARAPSPLF